MSNFDFDLVVLGGGPGGYVAAIAASHSGKKVALVEAGLIGGTCLNRGCIPTKALLASAHAYHDMKRANEFGLECEKVSFSFEKIMKRKDDIVTKLRDGINQLLKSNKITLLNGFGRLNDEHSLTINNEKKISFDKLIIATGSKPVNLPFMPEGSPYLVNSDQALNLSKLPQKLLVIGGGVIGMEMANFFAFLGVSVSIVEMMPQILPYEDVSVAKRVAAIFKKYNVTIKTGKKVSEIREDKAAGGVCVKLEGDAEPSSYDLVLQAVGRSRVIADINLAGAGIKTDGRKILTDDFMRTNISNVFAIGDCASDTMLAHMASHQGIIAAHNSARDEEAGMHKLRSDVPSCIYTIPEIASVGITQTAAQKKNIETISGKFMFNMLGRALCSQTNEGYVEVFADAKTKKVIGANIIGPSATELISTVQMAIASGLAFEEIHERVMFAHPTLSEALGEAFMDLGKSAIHVPPAMTAAR